MEIVGQTPAGWERFSTPGLIDPKLEAQIVKEIVVPSLEATRTDGFSFSRSFCIAG
jgi:hypothetical protein